MKVALSWTAVTGATSYRLYRGVVSGGPYLYCGTVVGTAFSDGPGNLPVDVTYFYRITSVNTDGESAFSTEITATAPAHPSIPTGGAAVVT